MWTGGLGITFTNANKINDNLYNLKTFTPGATGLYNEKIT